MKSQRESRCAGGSRDLMGRPRRSVGLSKIRAAGWATLGAGILALAGCAVGPDYVRPSMDTPSGYRDAEGNERAAAPDEASLGDRGWWAVFEDLQLRGYIGEALTNNWDVRIAAARVLQAAAAAKVARSEFFPNVVAGGDLVTTRQSERGPVGLPAGVDPQREYGDVFLGMSAYEVDLWGRIRRANEAARAGLLATESAQEAVRQTVVAEVATAYLQLLELEAELEISRRTVAVRNRSLDLTTSREEGGVASMQDVVQARILVATAEAAIADTQRRLGQKENELCLLLGRNPGSIALGTALEDQPVRAEVPVGLPSALLERRPDLRAAEQQLVAANADIGQAKAAYFPQITLTGNYGFQSISLASLFTGPAQAWQFGPTLTFPLFTGGRLRGNLRLAEARFQESVARYQQTVQNAFREVSDGLIALQRTREFRERQEVRTRAHREAAELASSRYEGGVTSYLEVLYMEQELFGAEITLAQARLNELLSVVQLYRALGGGWQGAAE